MEQSSEERELSFQLSDLSDEELAVLVKRQGMGAALDILVVRCKTMIWKLVHKARPYDLEDAAQQGFLAVLEAVKQFKIEKRVRFKTYAYWWIRRNVFRERDRQWKNGRAVELLENEVKLEDKGRCRCARSNNRQIEIMIVRETREEMRDAVLQLPNELCEVVWRRFWLEQTLREAGEAMGVSREYIRRREKEAFHLLKKYV